MGCGCVEIAGEGRCVSSRSEIKAHGCEEHNCGSPLVNAALRRPICRIYHSLGIQAFSDLHHLELQYNLNLCDYHADSDSS